MAQPSFRWSSDTIDTAVDILRNTSSYRTALQEIESLMGSPVSGDALRNAFMRAGKETPMRYVGANLRESHAGNVRYLPGAAPAFDIPVDVDLGELGTANDTPIRATPSSATPTAGRYDGTVLPLSGELEAHLYIPDMHHPFADAAVWQLILKAGRNLRRRFKRLRIIVLGDFCDMFAASFHDRDPRRGTQLASEIAATNAALDEVDALGADWKHYVEGNHEFRLARYLVRNAPALLDFESLTVPELLRLEARGWTFTPYRSYLRLGHLIATHDVGQTGATALMRAGAAFEHTVIQGHTHRAGSHYFCNLLGEAHVAASFGWGGSLDAVDYMYKVRATKDWIHGFGVGLMTPDGCVHLHPVPVVAGTIAVFGELIQ